MPKLPIDYSKGLIYTIIHVNDTSLNYVGSTTSFVDRKTKHKSSCKSSQLKLYMMIRGNGGFQMFKMMPYKEFPCQSSTELRIEEERCRLELNATLNTFRCHTTEEQKIEEKKEYYKDYHIENKDKLTEQKKEYNIKNADKIKEQKKEYYIENADKIKEQKKEYYIENADKIKEKQNIKHICDCGGKYTNCHKNHHELTKKHINFMENK